MQEILAGPGIWERIPPGERAWLRPILCDRRRGGQGSILGISWKGSHWGQQDTAEERHNPDHGGTENGPAWTCFTSPALLKDCGWSSLIVGRSSQEMLPARLSAVLPQDRKSVV